MPTLVDRRKHRLEETRKTQRKALAKLEVSRRRLVHQRKAFRRTRAYIRRLRAKVGKRKKLIEDLELALSSGPVTIEGGGGPGKVHGGTAEQRLVAVAQKAVLMHYKGIRHSFYSQSGWWTVHYAIMGEPRGARSDCSQWWLSVYWAADLPDPTGYNFTGGYTGTIGNHGRTVPSPGTPGGAGLYGSNPWHHVEMSMGDGTFCGHGSPPVDKVTPGWPSTFRDFV